MGNALAGYGVGAVAATLALAYVVSLIATVPFGLFLIGTATFGVIVFSTVLTSGDVGSATSGTLTQSGRPVAARKAVSANGRLTAAIYSTSLVVVSFALLVTLA
jgi:hypothetical protein